MVVNLTGKSSEIRKILRFYDLSITRLDGIVCVPTMDYEIRPGERVLVTGNVFTGSKLFKAIVGLWP